MAAVGGKKTVSDDDDDFYIAPFIEEPYDPNKIPTYCKRLVYDNGEEYSLEEIRARRYLRAIENDMKGNEICGEKLSTAKVSKLAIEEISLGAGQKVPAILEALTDKENYPNREKQANAVLKMVAAIHSHVDISRSGATQKGNKIYESLSIQKITDPQNEGKMDRRDGPKDISNVLLNEENNLRIHMEGIAGNEDISSNKCPVKISSVLQDVIPAQGISNNSAVHPPTKKRPMEKLLEKENGQQVKNCISPLDDSIPARTVPELPIDSRTSVKEDNCSINDTHLEDDVFTKPWSNVELDVTSYTKAFSMPAAISTPGFGGAKSRSVKGLGSEVNGAKALNKCIGEGLQSVVKPVVELTAIEENSQESASASSGANSAATLPSLASDLQNPGGYSSRTIAGAGGVMAETSRPQVSRIPCFVNHRTKSRNGCDPSLDDTSAVVNGTTQNETYRTDLSSQAMADICRKMKGMNIALDPFEPNQIQHFLDELPVPVSSRIGYYCVQQKFPIIKTNSDFHLRKEARDGGHLLNTLKVIGQGSYAKIYKGYSTKWKKMVALKVQKPACPWEFYISNEINSRVTDHLMKNSFMNVKEACIFNDGSVLISDYMEHGTLLDIINLFKIRRIRFPESLAVYFTIEVLRIINLLHSCKIIHADIKPDNFLLRRLPQVNEDFSSFGQTVLQLIDLGRCIDMSLYPENTCFNTIFQKTFFQCVEMRSGKEWSYQVDMFHIASLVHVMIFGDFMDVVCKDGVWIPTKKVPRNLNQDLWNWFFNSMLNIESCLELPSLLKIIERFEKIYLDSMVQDMGASVSLLRKFFNEDKAKAK
ncbi:uncharacterized protein LOC124162323 [Ischnura elegans]|uniref:uncharacterized protein LOC124162323 n=1 Tax=Ischnura elegans TaxID=197161 RepID=UPI001ED8ABE3|nr:uncharacterized protein LOC124162323 [Ischnura elegans]XP_046394783.1 uncharacterized protein LOC124162323 [Ischnura elegans]XP_046394784.1 uncharacterized protein LOC124162323 [Ischnura elegans]